MITSDCATTIAPAALAQHIPRSAAEATLSVVTGSGSAAPTRASCALFFGKTEISASATSKTTGHRKKVLIKWQGGE